MIDDDKIKRNHRERESKNAEESLQKSPEDLLKEIFICATDHKFQGAVTSTNKTIAFFSSLLVILSRQAEKSTKKIVHLTWALFGLTAALLLVAIIQIIILK